MRNRPLLVRRPAVGLLTSLAAWAVFAALLLNVVARGPLYSWDVSAWGQVRSWAGHNTRPAAMLLTTGIVRVVILGTSLLFAGVLLLRRRWPELTMLVLGLGGGEALRQIVGFLVARPRPQHMNSPMAGLAHNDSFPSGSATLVIVLFGLLVYLAWTHSRAKWTRTAAVGCFVAGISVITLQWLFDADHFPTDVLGGFALGVAWISLVCTGVEVAVKALGPVARPGRSP